MYPLQHFVAIIPKRMQFAPRAAPTLPVDAHPEPAGRERASGFRNFRWGSRWRSKFTGEGELAAPADENGNKPRGRRRGTAGAEAAPVAGSDRPSTLLTRCRNIVGGLSAASLPSSLSVESL